MDRVALYLAGLCGAATVGVVTVWLYNMRLRLKLGGILLVGGIGGTIAARILYKLLVRTTAACAGRGWPVLAPIPSGTGLVMDESPEAQAERAQAKVLDESIAQGGFALAFGNRRYFDEFAKAHGGVPAATAPPVARR
jgi:hypothetical protein